MGCGPVSSEEERKKGTEGKEGEKANGIGNGILRKAERAVSFYIEKPSLARGEAEAEAKSIGPILT